MSYYTPDISEFYVGFEYEEWLDGEWCGDIFEPNLYSDDIILFEGVIDEDEIRVKHLDKDDIESLGFDLVDNPKDYTNISVDQKILYLREDSKITHTNIQPLRDNEYAIFSGNFNSYGSYPKFLGTIKNKSELKKILKQIGV